MLKKVKKIIIFISLVIVVFAAANFVLAATGPEVGLSYAEGTGLSAANDPKIIAAKIIRIILGFLGIIAVGLIMYAGWLWMTAGGEADKIEKAKKILIGAVIGLLICLASFAIASFILSRLMDATGATGDGSICEPACSSGQYCCNSSCSNSPCGSIGPGGGTGISCDGIPLQAGCQADASRCGVGKYCNTTSCTCRTIGLPGENEPCLIDLLDTQCAAGQCAVGLSCSSSDCLCKSTTQPGEGESCDADPGLPDCQAGDCANNLVCSSSDNCTCVKTPLIAWVSPIDASNTPNGAVGNFITIGGGYFGTTTGQVVFMGDPNNPSDDRVATFPNQVNPLCTSFWRDNQIIAVVPNGAVSGPIKVIDSKNYYDTTDNNRGARLKDFLLNNIHRPGICNVNPSIGGLGGGFNVQGVAFDVTPHSVFFGNSAGAVAANDIANWTNLSVDAAVPNIKDGRSNVFVQTNNINSNDFVFTVINDADTNPVIEYIEPDKGPAGQYITIYGRNFKIYNAQKSSVKFYLPADPNAKINADIDFPEACRNDWWHNTYIVVKVPRVNNLGVYKVEVTNIDSKTSLPADFTINNETPAPGLCLLNPNNGPVGWPVAANGERFGVNQGSGRVQFFNNKDGAARSWAYKKIDTNVPVSSASGPFRVINGQGYISNSLPFRVGKCSASSECESGEECCGSGTYWSGICRVAGTCAQGSPVGCGFGWTFSTKSGECAINQEKCDIPNAALGSAVTFNCCARGQCNSLTGQCDSCSVNKSDQCDGDLECCSTGGCKDLDGDGKTECSDGESCSGYGGAVQSSGCANAGTTQAQHNEACNCSGTSGKFCLIDSANPTGICQDCAQISDAAVCSGQGAGTCCVDAKNGNACRGGGAPYATGLPAYNYCAYYECNSGSCSSTPVATSDLPNYPTLAECNNKCAPAAQFGNTCLESTASTQSCDINKCVGFTCLNEDGSGTTPPDACGTCCCDPNAATDQCKTINNNLSCLADKGSCSGASRGLCCGCSRDNECGDANTLGCGDDTCCQARPIITGTMPTDGASNACRNSLIKATFDQPMQISAFSGNIVVVGEYGADQCPTGTKYLTAAYKPSLFVRLANWLAKLPLLNKVFISQAQALTGNFCAVPGSVSGYVQADETTVLEFKLQKVLEANRKYYVIIKGDFDVTDAIHNGVLSQAGISMKSINEETFNGIDFKGKIWSFTTKGSTAENNGICSVDYVAINPPSYLFNTVVNNPADDDGTDDQIIKDSDKIFAATAYYAANQPIVPIEPFYNWRWDWSIDDKSVVKFKNGENALDNRSEQTLVAQNVKEASTLLHAKATIIQDQINKLATIGQFKENTAEVYVFLCANPWPPFKADGSWEPWRDAAGNCTAAPGSCSGTNFALYYCRDAGGAGTADDLPAIMSENTVIRGQEQNILKEFYFFREELPVISGINLRSVVNDEIKEGGKAGLAWPSITVPAGETLDKYLVYYGTGSKNYTQSITAATNGTEANPILISGLTNGVKYYFAVTARYKSGAESGYTNEINFTPADQTPPSAPQGLSGTISAGKATISWPANQDETVKYKVFYGSRSGVYGAVVDVGNKTSYELSGLNISTAYYFVVRAVDASNNLSDPSNEISLITGGEIIELNDGQSEAVVFSNNNQTGIINNVTGGDYLKLSSAMPTPHIWIANSNFNKVSKIRTFANCQPYSESVHADDIGGTHLICYKKNKDGWVSLSSAHEHPGQVLQIIDVGANPSRTAVNVETGDAWVANRDSANVTKIGYKNDGSGDHEVKKTCATGGGPRGIAIEQNGDVWIGNNSDGTAVKISGDDVSCDILKSVDLSQGIYGMAIDSENNVWAAVRGWSGKTYKINTATYQVSEHQTSGGACGDAGNWAYGMTVDFNDNVWVADTCTGVYRINKNQAVDHFSFSNLAHSYGRSRGVSVDSSGSIWVAMDYSNQVVKILNTNAVDSASLGYQLYNMASSFPVGIGGESSGYVWAVGQSSGTADVFNPLGQVIATFKVNDTVADLTSINPYTYSDMTGLNRAMILRSGVVKQIVDSQKAGQNWGSVSWQQSIPSAKQSIEVSLRAADDIDFTGENFISASDWNGLPEGHADRKGRYVQVNIIMRSNGAMGVTPVLWGLSIYKYAN